MSIISALQRRYATKKFDLNRQIPPEDLNELTEATRLTASSLGLQPYRLFVVTDENKRAALRQHSYEQSQITESNALFVFAVDAKITDATVDKYLDRMAAVRNCSRADLAEFEKMCKGAIGFRSPAERVDWAKKQAYIALGNLLTVAASKEIDACPMEGFDNAEYDRVLGLKELGLTSAVIAAVGYRAEDDPDSLLPKVRVPAAEFVSFV